MEHEGKYLMLYLQRLEMATWKATRQQKSLYKWKIQRWPQKG
uniref:Uncharacterized protein n=1 Tax=Arundo donax TaxID=35708 RepID=A0A0A8ZIS6_ARUDO